MFRCDISNCKGEGGCNYDSNVKGSERQGNRIANLADIAKKTYWTTKENKNRSKCNSCATSIGLGPGACFEEGFQAAVIYMHFFLAGFRKITSKRNVCWAAMKTNLFFVVLRIRTNHSVDWNWTFRQIIETYVLMNTLVHSTFPVASTSILFSKIN